MSCLGFQVKLETQNSRLETVKTVKLYNVAYSGNSYKVRLLLAQLGLPCEIIEVDILKDGRLDLADEVLSELDIVVASIHSFMSMERAEITERMLAGMENPYVQIIAHPTGRILLRRDAMAYDMERILDAARRHGIAMECNAAPDRLDLKDTYLRMAKDRGVRVVISTDAHSIKNLELMRYGVQMARRGWIEKKDVLNALPLEEMLAALRPKPGAASAKKAAARAAE